MRHSMLSPSAIRKQLFATAALGALSACASAPGNLTAGGPSIHTPQVYVPMVTPAVTSTLGGSELQRVFSAAAPNFTPIATTGSLNHDTGRLEIDDGTYLFIDPNGVFTNGGISNQNSTANGTLTPFSSLSGHVYDYIQYQTLFYPAGGQNYFTEGVIGTVTARADIPIAGTGRYTGDTSLKSLPNGVGSITPELLIGYGVSTVNVDFAAGLVNVDLSNFSNISGVAGAPVTPDAAAFDQVTGTGLVISGAHFTGGNWVTLKNGAPVNIASATATATSDGTFFGYDPSISSPDELGGVFVIQDAGGYVKGIYAAD